jgi:hypothetical protein
LLPLNLLNFELRKLDAFLQIKEFLEPVQIRLVELLVKVSYSHHQWSVNDEPHFLFSIFKQLLSPLFLCDLPDLNLFPKLVQFFKFFEHIPFILKAVVNVQIVVDGVGDNFTFLNLSLFLELLYLLEYFSLEVVRFMA